MLRADHLEILDLAVGKYEMDNGVYGVAKKDVEDLVFQYGGDYGDVYRVLALGMKLFFDKLLENQYS